MTDRERAGQVAVEYSENEKLVETIQETIDEVAVALQKLANCLKTAPTKLTASQAEFDHPQFQQPMTRHLISIDHVVGLSNQLSYALEAKERLEDGLRSHGLGNLIRS